MKCPNCNRKLTIRSLIVSVSANGAAIPVTYKHFLCPKCGKVDLKHRQIDIIKKGRFKALFYQRLCQAWQSVRSLKFAPKR